ncbi:hypothetical protein [Nannocystis pusilla]|uniref:Uncharacterized protein n=1 Tax=Nannocystis pusilla TaxID=889268 RepID=A0ABS7TJZ4_9BACT|nr:hypothetical protein [Nannocystis pusilla]MBZ5708555.1 hypothetical protein [Nannocystis pusilla]
MVARWISQRDVTDWNGCQSSLGNLPTETGLEDVLETSSEYGDCFRRIPDDARRSIAFAGAPSGVAWDTRGSPAGPYGVLGHTWHRRSPPGPAARGGARPRSGDGAAGSRGDEP